MPEDRGKSYHPIQCAYCGKTFADVESAREHQRYCSKYKSKDEDMKKYSTDIPPIPDAVIGCSCENCVGIKICPRCKENTMYLNRAKRIWLCSKCNCFDHVRNTKHNENFKVDGQLNTDLAQRPDVQSRLEFYRKNLKRKDL